MMISGQRQTTYGWLIAIDMFLAGAGAGVFFISFILDLLDRYEPVAGIGTLVGPVMALVGTVFLLAELRARTRVYRLLTNLSSWMSRGALTLAAFVVFGLAYSLASFGLPGWKGLGVGLGIGIVAGLLSLLMAIYPGLLFGVVRGIPFWNTPILPLLFFVASLYTGIAVVLLIGVFFETALGTSGFHQVGAGGIILILVQLLTFCVYFEITRHSGVSGLRSPRLLKTALFIGGVIITGLLVPLGLLSYSLVVRDSLILSILAGTAGVCLLAGGLLLRHAIIRAGTYQPLLVLQT